MSDESQPEICSYILRCGKNRGNRCTRKVSKKDSQGMFCCGHCIKRVDPPIEPLVEEESKEDAAPVADLAEVIDSISKFLDKEDEKEREQLLKEKEEEFEERFMKDTEVARLDLEYRQWKLRLFQDVVSKFSVS